MADGREWRPGEPIELSPALTRVLAPNPSPMTGPGTNSYLLGTETLAVIDPGPEDIGHFDALIRTIAGRPVSHILVTHSHLDHSPLAKRLSDATNAPVFGFGDSDAGRSQVMSALAAAGMQGGGEGRDHRFVPDITLKDGERIDGDRWHLDVLHTPGHMGNHICLKWDQAIFVGDLVMGWSTSLVSPPDGDMADFLASCHRLLTIPSTVYYPGHGASIASPHRRLQELIAHRNARTEAILDALRTGTASVSELVRRIYTDLAPALHPAAARNVFAHLVVLFSSGTVTAQPALQPDAIFALAHPKSRT